MTAKDCDWSFSRGTGAGGQKRNKTSSACHCTHKASGAQGHAEDTRSQSQNKQLAFERMANTDKFKKWHHLECLKRSGQIVEIDLIVEREMKNIKIEGKENGIWIELGEGAVVSPRAI